jgi:hypothetical protein
MKRLVLVGLLVGIYSSQSYATNDAIEEDAIEKKAKKLNDLEAKRRAIITQQILSELIPQYTEKDVVDFLREEERLNSSSLDQYGKVFNDGMLSLSQVQIRNEVLTKEIRQSLLEKITTLNAERSKQQPVPLPAE